MELTLLESTIVETLRDKRIFLTGGQIARIMDQENRIHYSDTRVRNVCKDLESRGILRSIRRTVEKNGHMILATKYQLAEGS